jgi:Lon protease-like protein
LSWLDRLRGIPQAAAAAGPERVELPLFPLGSVLFPGGMLALKVFEQRYLDMAADCLRRAQPFGVCLIASGKEVGEPATPHPVGTLAHVREADMAQLGILMLKVRGGRRFRIVSSAPQPNGLLRATVELLDEAEGRAIPAALAGVVPLLEKVAGDLGPERMPEPHSFGDAAWVGYRLAEILPVQVLAKQKLLELDDPVSRLEVIHAYLAQRRLVD